MKLFRLSLFMLLIIVLLSLYSFAESSLWTGEKSDIYQDRAEFNEGDVVTVIIDEAASALQSADTDTRKSSSVEGGTSTGILDFFGSFGLNYSDEDIADGSTSRQGNFEANITTQIVEMKDNGNMKIKGNKKVVINDEEQIISLEGIIRPEDIDLDNKIMSHKVAESNIEYKGEGPIAHRQRTGILSWLFGWIF